MLKNAFLPWLTMAEPELFTELATMSHLQWDEDTSCINVVDSQGNYITLYEYAELRKLLVHPKFGADTTVDVSMMDIVNIEKRSFEAETRRVPLARILDVIDAREFMFRRFLREAHGRLNGYIDSFFLRIGSPKLRRKLPEELEKDIERHFIETSAWHLSDAISQYPKEDRLTPEFYEANEDGLIRSALSEWD